VIQLRQSASEDRRLPPSPVGFGATSVTGQVTGYDGKCDGSGFRKDLIDNICDGVTAENTPGSLIRRRPSRKSGAVLDGQEVLLHEVEKNSLSPKMWYWAISQTGKFELAANQNDPAENERN
jgi:hypothetical protein